MTRSASAWYLERLDVILAHGDDTKQLVAELTRLDERDAAEKRAERRNVLRRRHLIDLVRRLGEESNARAAATSRGYDAAGPAPSRVRLGDLTAPQRRLVVALIDAANAGTR